MTPESFRLSLLLERFGQPVPEWHPPIEHLLAAGERTRLCETDLTEQKDIA